MLPRFTFSQTFFCTLTGMPPTEPRPRRPEVAEGMASARERGVRLGRPPEPLPASTERIVQLRDQGNSLAQIAAALNADAVPTPSGKGEWTKSSVQGVLRRWDAARPSQ